ncbi:hypothetical protein [Ramlibacter sp.]|uniref:hypothetical protein n=1 Tax=Ramlibacter sp. TaxID=1917967 RepID=UPI00260ACF94|nr:hypothetical protein [Ramlibacter sp.]
MDDPLRFRFILAAARCCWTHATLTALVLLLKRLSSACCKRARAGWCSRASPVSPPAWARRPASWTCRHHHGFSVLVIDGMAGCGRAPERAGWQRLARASAPQQARPSPATAASLRTLA